MSFWKQEPPKPTELWRNFGPIRESVPIALETSSISAPVSSHKAEIELMLEIRCARNALAVSFDNSDDQETVTKVSVELFWKLLIASLVMLVGGYAGEAGYADVGPAFVVGMAGWLYIIYEIFKGEASKLNENSGNPASQQAFKTIRAIVTFGWAIYPIGYYVAYMGDGSSDSEALNIIYNLADLVNKAAFGLAIWVAATSDSESVS